MLAIDTDNLRWEVRAILRGLHENEPNWQAISDQRDHLDDEVELHDTWEVYGPGEPLRSSPLDAMLQSLDGLKLTIQRRDKMRALQYAESALRAVDYIK